MIDPEYIARTLHHLRFSHLERRVCTAAAPMPLPDRDKFRWGHPDSEVIGKIEVGNKLDICRCPHCGLTFSTFPKGH